jgi:hypothetical protein
VNPLGDCAVRIDPQHLWNARDRSTCESEEGHLEGSVREDILAVTLAIASFPGSSPSPVTPEVGGDEILRFGDLI